MCKEESWREAKVQAQTEYAGAFGEAFAVIHLITCGTLPDPA